MEGRFFLNSLRFMIITEKYYFIILIFVTEKLQTMRNDENWTEYSEPDVTNYREGAGAIAVDESGEGSTAYFLVRGPNAPRMDQAIDTGSGINERMEGHGQTQLREGFAELLAYDSDEDKWYLPEALEEHTKVDKLEGKASELIKEDETLESIFTDYVMASMSDESPFAYNPDIETYESGGSVAPPGSEYVIEENDGGWRTGVITEVGEGGDDSLEYLTALPVRLPKQADVYDGEAFNTGDLRDEDGNWKLAEDRDGDWIWLDRFVAALGTDSNWNYSEKDGQLHQSGEVKVDASNEKVIEEIEDRQGLRNGATVKASAMGIDELLEN